MYWQTQHLEVGTDCQSSFDVNYAKDWENWTPDGSYNFSFSIPWIAEVNSTGGIVRLAGLGNPLTAVDGLVHYSGGVEEYANLTSNVTSASGAWIAQNLWGPSEPLWNVSSTSVGVMAAQVVFHLGNGTGNSSYSAKFDISLADWPWANATDTLGVGLTSLGAEGSHFTFNSTSQALIEDWNRSNATLVSVVFGHAATTETGQGSQGRAGQLAVTASSAFFFAASPNREASILLNFTGAGNYSSLAYDPWVVFNPNPIGPPNSANGEMGSSQAALELTLIAGPAAALAVGAVVIRTRRNRREAVELVQDIRSELRGGR